MTSFQMALEVEKSKKPFTIAEEFIKPCMLEMAANVLINQAGSKLELVPSSNNVIQSRLADLSIDILEHAMQHMKANPLKTSINFDVATDVASCSQFISLVMHVHEGAIDANIISINNTPVSNISILNVSVSQPTPGISP